jgi:hypothetical protein
MKTNRHMTLIARIGKHIGGVMALLLLTVVGTLAGALALVFLLASLAMAAGFIGGPVWLIWLAVEMYR